jgi:hypothetical protein
MKSTSTFAWIALIACVATPALASDQGYSYVYLRSNANQPWGQNTNEDAMDNIFGSGNWLTDYYESVNANSLLNSSTTFIFMEGGDSSYTAFANFINNNGDALYQWVYNGGRLLIMSAPNDPLNSATLYLPDNIILNSDSFYGSAASSAYTVNISSSIFSGPNSATYNLTGDFVAHGYFTGSDISPIMQSDLNEVILGQDQIVFGLFVFGGMTTDNFQLPQPAAHSLLENIIYYTAYASLD